MCIFALNCNNFFIFHSGTFTVKEEPQDRFPCNFCGRVFSGLRNMNGHLSHCPVKKNMAEQRNPAPTTPVQYQSGAEGKANGSLKAVQAADNAVSDSVDNGAQKLDLPAAEAGNHRKEEGKDSVSEGKDASKQ